MSADPDSPNSLQRHHMGFLPHVRESARDQIELTEARICSGLRNKIVPACRYVKLFTSTWTRFMRPWSSGTIRNSGEPLSLDEAHLDVSENKTGLATATQVARTIRQQIQLSPTRKLLVLPGAPRLSASPANRSLLPPSSTTVFAIPFRSNQFPRAQCHVSCRAAQSRHGLTPLLTTIEFA